MKGGGGVVYIVDGDLNITTWEAQWLHVRIQEFLPWGGGSRHDCQKTALTTFLFCFFSPQLILQFYSGLSMVYLKENIILLGFRGGSTFSRGWGGGPTFSREGRNANLYRNP